MKAKKMQYGGVKKMQKGGSKLISTVNGTSAINTKLNPKKILETGFNYNTELAKKQKADAAAKAAKAAVAKRAAAKVASGKKVKAVIEGITRDNPKKTPVKPKATTQYKPVGSAKVSITNSKIKIEPNLGKSSSSVKTPVVKTPAGKTVSEIWKEKTGTSWSEAKKQGLTDGSYKSNIALLAKLKSGSFDKENQPPARMETVKATDMKVSSTGPTELTGVKSPEKKKKGGIIKTKKK
jgi:hypothetical protein